MRKYHILIKDASRGRFRVCQMGPNGEMINQSQALDTVDNVLKNILAGARVFKMTKVKSASHLKTDVQRLMHVTNLTAFDPYIFIRYKGKNKHLKNWFS